jgi:hypothetical protein
MEYVLSFEQTFHHSNTKPFILCAEECLLLLAFLNFWTYALLLVTPRYVKDLLMQAKDVIPPFIKKHCVL